MKYLSGLGLADFKPFDINEIVPGLAHIRHMQEMVRPVDLVPSSMRAMLDLQQSLSPSTALAGHSHLHGIAGTLGTQHSGGIISALVGPFRHLDGIMDTLRVTGGVQEMLARQFPGVTDFEHLHHLQGFAAQIDGVYPSLVRNFGPKGALAWQASVLGSLRGLEGVLPYLSPYVEPVGVVAMLSPSRAAFTWMTESEDTLAAHAAALRAPRRSARELRVRLKVDCARCGDPMALFDLAQTIEGDILDVSARAFPVCVRCVKETGGDLERLIEEALSPKPPALKIFSGERQGPPAPRGQLRLAPVVGENDDE